MHQKLGVKFSILANEIAFTLSFFFYKDFNAHDEVKFQILQNLKNSTFPASFSCSFKGLNNNKINLTFKIVDGLLTKPLSDTPNVHTIDENGASKLINLIPHQVRFKF